MAQVSELGRIGQFDLTSIVKGVQGTLNSGYNPTKNPLAAVIKTVTVSTNYSPEKTYTGMELEQKIRDKEPNWILDKLRPVAVIDTHFGRFDFEPYGKNDVGIWKANVAQAVLFVASGVLLYSVGMFVWGRHVGRKGG